MKRKFFNLFIIAILVFTISGSISAEKDPKIKQSSSSVTSDEILFSCSYILSVNDNDCIPDNFGSYTPDNISVAIVLKKILGTLSEDSSVKITANFLTYECSFPQPVFKALTKRSDSTRYILYTKKQLDELMLVNTNWVAYSIFAHEIAHHLYGHTLSSSKSLEVSRTRELQADFFSGYILHKLKATLQESQSGINAFTDHPAEELEEFCTHPCKSKRLEAVKKGYEFETGLTANTRHLLNLDSLRNEKGLEQIFNKSLQMYFEKNYQSALRTLNELAVLLQKNKKADYFNNSGLIKQAMGDMAGAIKDYNAAIEINNTKSEYFFNRAELKKISASPILKAESMEDFKQAIELKKIEQVRRF